MTKDENVKKDTVPGKDRSETDYYREQIRTDETGLFYLYGRLFLQEQERSQGPE